MKLFIVEDHALMRSMLKEFIEALPQLEVIGTCQTAEEAIGQIPSTDAELVLIDVSLPEMSGIDLVREIKALQPDLPCLMLTGHQEMSYVERAMEAGASGYVIKGDPFDLYEAIEKIQDGEEYLSQTIQRKVKTLSR